MTTTEPMTEWRRRAVYAAQRGYRAGAVIPPEMTPRQSRRYFRKQHRRWVAGLRKRSARLSPRTTDLTRREGATTR